MRQFSRDSLTGEFLRNFGVDENNVAVVNSIVGRSEYIVGDRQLESMLRDILSDL